MERYPQWHPQPGKTSPADHYYSFDTKLLKIESLCKIVNDIKFCWTAWFPPICSSECPQFHSRPCSSGPLSEAPTILSGWLPPSGLVPQKDSPFSLWGTSPRLQCHSVHNLRSNPTKPSSQTAHSSSSAHSWTHSKQYPVYRCHWSVCWELHWSYLSYP